MRIKLAIVGAGPAGVIAARNAVHAHHDIVVFEKLEDLGGVWNPKSGGGYQNLVMQNSHHTFHYTSFHNSVAAGFPTLSEVSRYLRAMVDHENLYRFIRFNSEVIGVTKHENKWKVTYRLKTGEYAEFFDAVIIATGEFWKSRIPEIKNYHYFKGNVSTSRDYHSPKEFDQQNILVVGDGISGADIASDLVSSAKSVTLSVKNLGLFLPRQFPSGCSDLMHSYMGRYLLQEIPYNEYLDYLKEIIPEYMEIYKKAGCLPLLSNNNAVHVNEKFIPNVAAGRILLKKRIREITADGAVQFIDDTAQKFDSIVFCAGYQVPDYSFINGFNRELLYEHFFYVPDTTLFIINPPIDTAGFGAALPYFDLISQWVIDVLSGNTKLPSKEKMYEWCNRHMKNLHLKRFYDSWIETIRIGLKSQQLPDPHVEFNKFWLIISSAVKPGYLRKPPTSSDPGILDSKLDLQRAKIRLLASFSQEILQSLYENKEITQLEYRAAQTIPKDLQIDIYLTYRDYLTQSQVEKPELKPAAGSAQINQLLQIQPGTKRLADLMKQLDSPVFHIARDATDVPKNTTIKCKL